MPHKKKIIFEMITYLIVDFGVCSGLVFGRFIARSHVFCCVFRGPVRIGGGNSKESGEEEELLIQ